MGNVVKYLHRNTALNVCFYYEDNYQIMPRLAAYRPAPVFAAYQRLRNETTRAREH